MTKPPTMPPKLPPSRPPNLSKPSPSGRLPAKTFSVSPWTDSGQGTKGVLYAPAGMGKTTLASMAPSPIFIGVDDGGRKIVNPKTGEPINSIPQIETYQDIRDALHQPGLFPKGSTLVLDTITKTESLAEPHLFATVKDEKGQTVEHMEGYGYGKGYKHLLDAMRLLLADFDGLVRMGVNILLLAQQGQATVANLEGTDYLEDGPKLSNTKAYSVRSEVVEWADHVFRIGHPDLTVVKANAKATKGKVSGSTERVIYTRKQLHFMAKSRPVAGYSIPEVISFASPADDSLWQYLFHGARADETV